MKARPFQHAPSGAVVFGAGSSSNAGAQGPLKKAARVLVVTDKAVRAAGLIDKALASLGDRVAFIDDGTIPDGDVAHIDELAGRAKAANVDGILAVGGGSVMDTAKGVGAVVAKGQSLAALEGLATIRARLPPLVCVPTTSGTGSEATQFAVIKDRAEGRKRIYMDLSLVPAQSFLDPELLVGLPRAVTAATGVDAITHAVEAIASQMRNPIASALAAEALRLLVLEKALERALAKPDDIDARGACLVAANLAGQAISSAMLGACHAFAHALGAHKGVAHGVANGVFLIPVMRANAEKARGAYAHLASAIGVSGAAAAIDAIEQVVHDVAGIPRALSALGVSDADVPELVRLTLADGDLATNPVPFDEDAVRAVLSARMVS